MRSHTFKVGGEFRRFFNQNFTSDTGTFNFGSLADFQSGVGNNFAITLGDRPSDVRAQAAGLFAQDAYRAAANLSFDLGLRFDANLLADRYRGSLRRVRRGDRVAGAGRRRPRQGL